MTTLFGYGPVKEEAFQLSLGNKALVLAADVIATDQTHTYQLPLPPSLNGRKDWHRVVITLAYNSPTNGRFHNHYRGAHVEVSIPECDGPWKINGAAAGPAKRGTVQQITVKHSRVLDCPDGTFLPIRVIRMPGRPWARTTCPLRTNCKY